MFTLCIDEQNTQHRDGAMHIVKNVTEKMILGLVLFKNKK